MLEYASCYAGATRGATKLHNYATRCYETRYGMSATKLQRARKVQRKCNENRMLTELMPLLNTNMSTNGFENQL